MTLEKKFQDFLILVSIITLSTFLFFAYITNPMTAAVLWLVLPTSYILIRLRKSSLAIIMFSAELGIKIFIAFYFANLYNLWFVPSIYPRLLNVTLEETLFAFFWPMFIVGSYNLFFDLEKTLFSPSKIRFRILVLWIAIFLFGYLAEVWNKLKIPYPYLVLGVLFVIPKLIRSFYKNKNIAQKWIRIGIVFFILQLAAEIVALKLHLWEFSGQYIAMLNIINVSFPIEEFVLWIVLGAPLVISLWENFRLKKR